MASNKRLSECLANVFSACDQDQPRKLPQATNLSHDETQSIVRLLSELWPASSNRD